MDSLGAIVFLPRDEGSPCLMLEPILFDPAAAWLAAAGLLTGRSAGSAGEGFTIGEVSLSRADPAQSRNTAECLRRQAWRLLRPYCRDGDFVFRGVPG